MTNNESNAKAKKKLSAGQNKLNIDMPEILGSEPGAPFEPNEDRTVGRMLGDIVWVMSQSPGHKHFALADLEWMVMPALILGQYRIFRDGQKPVGVALWAYLDEEAEKKVEAGVGRLRPDEWKAGSKLDPEKGIAGGEGGKLWLIDLVCPFATPDNKLVEKCMADLIGSVFKGKAFKFHQTDLKTRERKVVELKG
jgi:cytolysin-activating lysine-acyltransferase